MARTVEILLTGRRDDGSWTWRVADAREPRGEVIADLVPDGAQPGSRFRAEMETAIDSVELTRLLPIVASAQASSRGEPFEILGSRPRPSQDVSTREQPGRSHDRAHGDTGDSDRHERWGRRTAGSAQDDQRSRRRTAAGAAGSHAARGTSHDASRSRSRDVPGDPASRRAPTTRGSGEGRPVARPISTVHRDKFLAQLSVEHIPIAEELIRGGIPAVRNRLAEQSAAALRDGRPAIAPEPILSLAEELLPSVNLASWKDRAETARTLGKTCPLHDLRSIVSAASQLQLDEDAAAIAAEFSRLLTDRVAALRRSWEGRIGNLLKKGETLEALRASASPPDRGSRVPADLAIKLATAASEALSPDASEPTWMELLAAVVSSPVHRNVHPAGLPPSPSAAMVSFARRYAGVVPGLAKLLGMAMPPPPVKSAG